jgi:hypothetical protein
MPGRLTHERRHPQCRLHLTGRKTGGTTSGEAAGNGLAGTLWQILISAIPALRTIH